MLGAHAIASGEAGACVAALHRVRRRKAASGLQQADPFARKVSIDQVEWAWGRRNERVDAYYIHRGRTFWVLWIYAYDDNWSVWN